MQAARPLTHHRAGCFVITEFRRHILPLGSGEMAEKVGLSQRRFIEIFRGEVGLAPKLFCRMLRFRRAATDLPR